MNSVMNIHYILYTGRQQYLQAANLLYPQYSNGYQNNLDRNLKFYSQNPHMIDQGLFGFAQYSYKIIDNDALPEVLKNLDKRNFDVYDHVSTSDIDAEIYRYLEHKGSLLDLIEGWEFILIAMPGNKDLLLLSYALPTYSTSQYAYIADNLPNFIRFYGSFNIDQVIIPKL